MNTQSKAIVVLISIMSILGCGGEEESKTAEVAAPTETTTPESVDNSVQETTITADLISAPDFNLSSSNELQISLSASPSSTVNYFINICTDFAKQDSSKNNESIKINYASCKLRTKVALTEKQFTLSISPVEKELIAQIWPIENGAQPINFYWNIDDSGKDWQITF